MKVIALFFALAMAAPLPIVAETTEIEIPPDATVYGEYPKTYQEIITQWLQTQLVDAPSANIEWVTPPKPASLPGPEGQRLFGYLVEFKVNSRNRFGAYTGMQKHGALIREGKVVKGTGFGY